MRIIVLFSVTAMTHNRIFLPHIELLQRAGLCMAAEWTDWSFVTGTGTHGDKRVYPENGGAVDCNFRSPITENGVSLWLLLFHIYF